MQLLLLLLLQERTIGVQLPNNAAAVLTQPQLAVLNSNA
jgi:hypothetical protein